MLMYRPTSLAEALDALAEHPEATLLAGGTDLMVEINLTYRRPETVIALRRVPELQRWEDRFIGGGVTYERLEHSDERALAEAARTVGSPQIRAAGTIGGNVSTASPAGDTLPFLYAAGATVLLASKSGERRLPVAEFITGVKETDRRPDEVVVGVELPDAMPQRQAFAKVGPRQAMVIAVVNACVFRFDDGTTRLALGAVGPTIVRAEAAEAQAASLDVFAEGDFDEFQRLVSAAARPITDHRSTAEYRSHAVGVVARRALERCLAA